MILSNAHELYMWLKGDWEFSRTINDILNSFEATAKGKAIFTRAEDIHNNQLFYVETGVLYLPNSTKPINFNKSYIYTFEDDLVYVYFNDGPNKGNLFQKLSTADYGRRQIDTTSHLCINDLYEGIYYFMDTLSFSINYKISGPNKKMNISTIFTKINENIFNQ